MAPTAVCERSAFTPATAASRPKSSKPSSRFVSPSRIARFFGGRELWRWSRGGSVAGVESFSDGAGDADADAAGTKGDAGISAPCAEGVGVASLIARGDDSSWSPARWYTPSSSAASSSSAALGRSPAAAFSPATASAGAAREGGGAKRHHHLPRPLSKKDPESMPPSSRAGDILQTPPMPPLPQRPVPRQWANSHIPLEKPVGGGTEESPAAKVAAADGDDKDGGAATPVPPATQAGAAEAAAATDAVGARHEAERDRRAASSPPEDRSAAREEEGTGGGERATPPSSPRPLQEVVKSRLNSSFDTTASSLGSESSDYYTRLRSFATLLVGCGGGSDRSVSGSPSLSSIPLPVPVSAGGECPSGPPPQDKPEPFSVDVPLPVDNASPSDARKEAEAGEQAAQDRSPSRGSAREDGRTNTTGHGHSKTCGGGGGGGGGEQESSQALATAPGDRATSSTQVPSLRGTTPLTSPVRVPPTLWSSPAASPRREGKAVVTATTAAATGGGGGVGVAGERAPSKPFGDRGRDDVPGADGGVWGGGGVSDDTVESRLQGPHGQEEPRSADVAAAAVGASLAVDPVLSPAALAGDARAPAPEVVMSSRKRAVGGVVEAARESLGWSEFLASSSARSRSTAPAKSQGQGAATATPSATTPGAAAPMSTVAGANESGRSSSAKATRGGNFVAGAGPGLRAMGGRALRGATAAATRSFSPSSHSRQDEWHERGCSSALGRRKAGRFFGPELAQAFSEGDVPQRWSPGLRGTTGEEAREDSAGGTVVAKKPRGGGGSPFVVCERGRLDVGFDSGGGGGKNYHGTSPGPESQRATSVPVPPLPSPTAGAAAGSYPSPFENAGWSSGRRRGEEAAQEGASVSAERAALMTASSFSSAASEESRLSSQPPDASGERLPAPVLWPSGSSSSASGTSRQLLAGTTVGDCSLVVVGETVAPSSPAAAMAMVAVKGSPLMREEQQWQRQPGPLSPRLLGEQQQPQQQPQQQQQRKERQRRQQSFLDSLDHRDGKGSTPSPVEHSSWHRQGQREHQGRLPSRSRGGEEPATTPTESGGGTPEREVDPSGGVPMPLSPPPGPPGRVELGSSCGNSSLNNSANGSSILSGSSEYYTRLRSFAALVGGGGGGDPDSHLDGSTRSSITAGSAVPQSSPLRPFGCPETRSRAASSPASGSSSDAAQRRGSTSPHALLPLGPNESMSMPSSLSSTPPPPCRPFDAEAGSETGSSSLSQATAPNETQLTAESLGMVGTTATPTQRTALESNILSFLGVHSGGGGGSGAGWGSRRSRSSGGGGGGLFRGESFFEDDENVQTTGQATQKSSRLSLRGVYVLQQLFFKTTQQ
ncbi:unnamed protein product [Ectocarpus sp. 6 AP-2014]